MAFSDHDGRFDVVYTWVDQNFPGYQSELAAYSNDPVDLDAERTRDNLDLLKYSLRSLERCVPWLRHLYLVTCRPQVPPWLDTQAPGLRLVHHDQFFDKQDLPTFNSFSILTNLYRLPDLSDQFVWMCDDILFGRPVAVSDLITPEGKILVYPQVEPSAKSTRWKSPNASGWIMAQAWSNHLLDERYGKKRRRMLRHTPHLIDRSSWQQMIEAWPDDFRRTLASRFRARQNVAPEHLYPYFLLEEGLGEELPLRISYARAAFDGLNNNFLPRWFWLNYIRRLQPQFYCLNDNFGPRPNPRVESFVRRWLQEWYPQPSRWEKWEDQSADVAQTAGSR